MERPADCYPDSQLVFDVLQKATVTEADRKRLEAILRNFIEVEHGVCDAGDYDLTPNECTSAMLVLIACHSAHWGTSGSEVSSSHSVKLLSSWISNSQPPVMACEDSYV